MGNSKSQFTTAETSTNHDRGSNECIQVRKCKETNRMSAKNRAKAARQVKVTRKRKMKIEFKAQAINIDNQNQSKSQSQNYSTPKKSGDSNNVPISTQPQLPLTPQSHNTEKTSLFSPERSSSSNVSVDSINISMADACIHKDSKAQSPDMALLDQLNERDDSSLVLVSDEERASPASTSVDIDESLPINIEHDELKPVIDGLNPVDRQKLNDLEAGFSELERDWRSHSSLMNTLITCQATNENANTIEEGEDTNTDDFNEDFDQMMDEFERDESLGGDSEDDAIADAGCDNDQDDNSIGSDSILSQSDSSAYGSLGPYSTCENQSVACSVGELSVTPSTASLFKDRKMSFTLRSRIASSSTSPSTSSRKIRPLKPTAQNAFETLPKHLISMSLLRQAASTLRDERFLNRRILKLGAVHASRIHVSDLFALERKVTQDAEKLENERTALEASIPTSATFADGESLDSLTIFSLELFEKCILHLCGIQMVEPLPVDDTTDSTSNPKSPVNRMDQMQPQLSLLDGGKALYYLGKFCQKANWNDDAMQFYKHALYLYFLDLGVEEPRLLDNLDDCDGFFYVQAARGCVRESSNTHQYLGALFTKMGDVHGCCGETNDALRAYRASEVFWRKFISDVEIFDAKNETDAIAAVEALALSFNRIGGVYTSKGELESAVESFHEALQIQRDILGQDHIEVAKTLHNIGVCHRHGDNLELALENYIEAHEILEASLGRDHIDTVRTLHNIGGVYRRQKEYTKAMECFKEVLDVRRDLLGDDHPSVAITLVSMAAALRRCGRKEEANKFYAAAVR